jgi:hypothetical protein
MPTQEPARKPGSSAPLPSRERGWGEGGESRPWPSPPLPQPLPREGGGEEFMRVRRAWTHGFRGTSRLRRALHRSTQEPAREPGCSAPLPLRERGWGEGGQPRPRHSPPSPPAPPPPGGRGGIHARHPGGIRPAVPGHQPAATSAASDYPGTCVPSRGPQVSCPFGLSLSKPCRETLALLPFDRLRANGRVQFAPFDRLRANGRVQFAPFDRLRANGRVQFAPFDRLRANGRVQFAPFDKLRANGIGV